MTQILLVMSVVTAVTTPDGIAPRPVVTTHMHRLLTSPDRHVRTLDRRVADALAEGVRRSATFEQLVTALDTSDVIAYIEFAHDLPSTTLGRLILATRSQANRYVRIHVRPALTMDELIATIGHELRHAVEIAEAPIIRDEASMRRYYQRAGAGRSHGTGFETRAAQDAGYRVRSELRKNA